MCLILNAFMYLHELHASMYIKDGFFFFFLNKRMDLSYAYCNFTRITLFFILIIDFCSNRMVEKHLGIMSST